MTRLALRALLIGIATRLSPLESVTAPAVTLRYVFSMTVAIPGLCCSSLLSVRFSVRLRTAPADGVIDTGVLNLNVCALTDGALSSVNCSILSIDAITVSENVRVSGSLELRLSVKPISSGLSSFSVMLVALSASVVSIGSTARSSRSSRTPLANEM